MTAELIPRIGCDRCGVIAQGADRDTTVALRARLQQAGWTYERHVGTAGRDYCAACSGALATEREAAA